MPGLSGIETAIPLRRHAPRRVGIPIINLTANAFGTDHTTYLAAGMNCCVAKPFEETELYDRLLRLTGRGPATE